MADPANETLAQLEAELAELHREWHRELELHPGRGKDGKFGAAGGGSLASSIILMVGSVVGIAFVAASPLPAFVAYLGFIPFSIGTFRLLIGSMKSERHERAQTAYESRKRQILSKIARLQNGGRAG